MNTIEAKLRLRPVCCSILLYFGWNLQSFPFLCQKPWFSPPKSIFFQIYRRLRRWIADLSCRFLTTPSGGVTSPLGSSDQDGFSMYSCFRYPFAGEYQKLAWLTYFNSVYIFHVNFQTLTLLIDFGPWNFKFCKSDIFGRKAIIHRIFTLLILVKHRFIIVNRFWLACPRNNSWYCLYEQLLYDFFKVEILVESKRGDND